ncbi:MAG TPA: helical backbone metal receptor [Bacteroidales bacterium]|nr:helical backbone metal receptor [Bacteroidales bacterium]
MKTKDQVNRILEVSESPERIISLVPSITELLVDLEMDRAMLGRTRFCIHPAEKVKNIPVVGGVMGLNRHEIDKMQPDLIFASREENAQNEIMELANDYPVWVSDVHNLEEALAMIDSIGKICGKPERASQLTEKIREGFRQLDHIPPDIIRAAYLVWNNPLYTINANTFIHDMLKRCGIVNIFADKAVSYPVITEKELRERKPDFLFLPSEPYTFKEKDVRNFSRIVPKAEIKRVDGEYFTWYGSHLVDAPSYFKHLF